MLFVEASRICILFLASFRFYFISLFGRWKWKKEEHRIHIVVVLSAHSAFHQIVLRSNIPELTFENQIETNSTKIDKPKWLDNMIKIVNKWDILIFNEKIKFLLQMILVDVGMLVLMVKYSVFIIFQYSEW